MLKGTVAPIYDIVCDGLFQILDNFVQQHADGQETVLEEHLVHVVTTSTVSLEDLISIHNHIRSERWDDWLKVFTKLERAYW